MSLVQGNGIAGQSMELPKGLITTAFGVRSSQMYPRARIAELGQTRTRRLWGTTVPALSIGRCDRVRWGRIVEALQVPTLARAFDNRESKVDC
jgi:hypothetical protein